MQGPQDTFAKDGFRLRGASSSRVDNFSDVVFGFALTLIVVSGAVPHTFDELRSILLGFYPFAICFLLFITIWHAHFRFFRRFGVHDTATIWINFVLLFTVLLYIYPLKFVFTFASADTASKVFSNPYQSRELMILYGAGYAALQLCFAALYGNAWRNRMRLALNPLETTLTLSDVWNYVGRAAISLTCCIVARLLPPQHAGEAGYSFLLLIPWGRTHGIISRKHIRAARARTDPQDIRPQQHEVGFS